MSVFDNMPSGAIGKEGAFSDMPSEGRGKQASWYRPITEKYSKMAGLNPDIIDKMIQVESSGNPSAVSPKGARGLMQLMPNTAKEMGVKDPHDPEQNIMGGTKYFSQLLKKFGGDTRKALAAYNAGPARVDNPPKETHDYVNKIMEGQKEEIAKSPSLRSSPPESFPQKTWDKVKEVFGPDWDKERAKASNSLVYSEMLNIKPSQAYKYADEIADQLQHNLDGEKVMTENKGEGTALKEGLDNSIFGMMARGKTVEPFESVDQLERWTNTFATMAADAPFYLAGYLMGGPGGSFGFTQGVRRVVLDRYNKGKIQNFSDLMDRFKSAALDTIKGEVTGKAMEVAGAVSPYGTKALMQLATITTVGKLVEGQVPTAKDFKDNAAVLLAMSLGIKGTENAKGALQEVWAKTGKHPAEVVDTLKKAAPLTGEEQETKPGLKPAVKVGDKIVAGDEGDTHNQTIEKSGVGEKPAQKVYHGTDTEGLKNISSKGIKLGTPSLVTKEGVRFGNEFGFSVSKDMGEAKKYGDNVLEFEISPAAKIALPKDLPEVFKPNGFFNQIDAIKLAKEKGFDAVDLDAFEQLTPEPGKSKELQILNPDILKTQEEPERGFVTPPTDENPEGDFLNREQAAKWVEENEPDVHESWKGIAGEDSEFHSENYNKAKELSSKGNQLLTMLGDETGAINLDPAIQLARQYLDKIKEGKADSKYGHALRTLFVGLRDSKIAETNQLRDELAKLIPDYKDQEALSLLRDFKNKPDELKAKREQYAKGDNPELKKVLPIIDHALDPSIELLEADRKMTEHFESIINEGKRLGILDSNIPNDEYITHLLEPEEMAEGVKGLSQGKIGRSFQFAKERKYPTMLDAMEAGVKVKTFNALDAMTIHGDKFATARATKLLIDELKTTNMGKWGFKNADNIPNDWVELAPGRELFRNRRAYIDKETGEPTMATQNLYVPQVVQKALAPIIDPASISNIPGFRSGRLYQAWIKGVELGLSIFHMKAMNITALNNEKLSSLVKSYRSNQSSPEFKAEEIDLINSGGTTSILGRTIEAYHAAKPSSLPTRMDIIRNTVGIKQIDKFAEALTHETFDVMQRNFKVVDFSLKKAAWIAEHEVRPERPEKGIRKYKKELQGWEEQYTEAKRSIAKEVNAVYGGLNWEVLGVNKNTLELTKALMLAPDWTFSNVFNLKYAFEGGPAGESARKFWIKSAITGIAFSEGMSMLLTGQGSKHPTEVYMGKDKDGKEIYSNMFFAGAPKDFVSLITNIKNYGAVMGIAHSIAGKLGPLARTGMDVLTNKDWTGQPIVRREDSFLKKTAKGAGFAAEQLAPIPFSISNIGRMLMDDKIDYSMQDFIAQLGGSPPRHEAPFADTKTRSRKRYNVKSWGH